MIRLNKVHCFVILCLCFSFVACKKVAKDVAENVAEKTIARQSSKEAAKDILLKTGKKDLKEITWRDLHSAISKEMPALGKSIDQLDKPVLNAFEKVCSKDFRFVRALTSSNSILDRCKVYSAEAPTLMKDANFIRMFVKSDIARKEGRHCLIDDLIAKEEKGFVKFYHKGTRQLTAEYRDGVVNVYDKAILNQELIPNAHYTIRGEAGKRCSFHIDDLGRIQSVEARNMSPDEITSDIVNRTGSNDFGRDWDKAFRTLKQSSRQDDINIKCVFRYANNDEIAPKYARIDADIRGKKTVSSTFKNTVKDIGNKISRSFTRIIIRGKNQYITSVQYIKFLSEHSGDIRKTGVKDAQVLRENMLAVMGKYGKYVKNTLKNGNQAHHIVGNKTPKAAATLKKFGIDINDPMNGIFLPSSNRSGLKGTIHRGGHTQDYYDYIEQMFSNCKTQEDCYAVLDKIKEDLYHGKIKLYSDEVHQVNKTF